VGKCVGQHEDHHAECDGGTEQNISPFLAHQVAKGDLGYDIHKNTPKNYHRKDAKDNIYKNS